jgi:phospholipase C
MLLKPSRRKAWLRQLTLGAAVVALAGLGLASAGLAADPDQAVDTLKTASPIKHLIVIIGENRSFDHVFGTYRPRDGQSVSNLLSKGIVTEDGTPGPNFAEAAQFTVAPQTSFFISADKAVKTAYTALPPPDLNRVPLTDSDSNSFPPFGTVAKAIAAEPDLETEDAFLLTTGAAVGLTFTPEIGTIRNPDTRIANVTHLPNGPFQLTGPTMPYDAYTEDTIHRFYQMWQQTDCSTDHEHASRGNPTGCLSDLWPFVTTTFAGTAENGMGTPMAFFNVSDGDAPVLKRLADQYALSDNFHQAAMGGTGVSHVYLGFADDVFFSDGKGTAISPIAAFGPTLGPLVIANPNPVPATNNTYLNDGFYTNCSDPAQPGAAPILNYLGALAYRPHADCDAGHFYLLNNLFPGFHANGTPNIGVPALGISPLAVVPPSAVRNIGDALIEKNIPFAYYGGGFNLAVAAGANDALTNFCPICNPFQYATSIMATDAVRQAHTKDVLDLFAAIDGDTMPAVAYVKPDEFLDGHPQSSKLDLFEAFVENIVDKVKAKPELFAETAIVVTFDEGGGYYDSGFIQPVDFFGDGPRIPAIVVSPFSTGGRVVHTYYDHVSVVKFIERNWLLAPLTNRSRDNLPNPRSDDDNPYVPTNMPAIGDLFDMFDFDGGRDGHDHEHDREMR